MDYLLDGGSGLISVTADVAPREMAELVKACHDGDRQAAESINKKVGGMFASWGRGSEKF